MTIITVCISCLFAITIIEKLKTNHYQPLLKIQVMTK